jgi:PAS domain S-box-containing protein
MYRTTLDGRYLDVNPALARMHGCETPEAFIGHFRNASVHTYVDPASREELIRQMRDQGYVRSLESEAYRRNGTRFWISVTGHPLWDDEGQPVGYECFVVDITERKQLEQQVRQSVKMKAIGQLTGGMAHDFNNLLAVILANLELLEESELTDDQQRGFIEPCIRSARRGAELTHRLLAFARGQPLAPQVTEVNALLTSMTDLLRRTLGENIAIKTEWDANLGKISIDPGELESAVLNLAINARDAMPDGGNLIVETRNAELDRDYAERNDEVQPGSYVMLAISDTGIGMPPEILDHVFEPFFTTKDVGRGSGLGLSMVYGFVKQSGGHIKVYSEPGIGSTIKIYLPILAGTDEPCSVAELEANKPRGNGEIVLLVEDSADVRKSVARRLKKLGYQVLEAADGPSALTVLREASRIDLLFTDLVLPHGMRGVALASEARNHHPAMRVLYMSGYTENVVGQKGILDDRGALIGKPFTAIELAHALREALGEVEG